MFRALFSSFFPFENPIGFGASDFVEAAIAVLLVTFALVRPGMESAFNKLGRKTVWCMAILAILPVVLRLALLKNHPVPSPDVYAEFGHLLVADTLRHFRLANPPHVFSQFFETFFVLQQPTYSSIYPIGSGLILAIGRIIFGHPWAGVVLSIAAFCSLCYWMLRAWTTPAWALAGGLLTVIEFSALNPWMNSYWGGGVAACAGCLVFGALPRLNDTGRPRDAALLGIGLGLHLLTRQYESIFLLLGVILFFIPAIRRPEQFRKLVKAVPIVVLAVFPAIALTLLQNRAVTGSCTTLPYTLSQYQYGVPAALTFQPNPIPHRDLTPQQQLDYRMQVSFRGVPKETFGSYSTRLEYRIRFYRFFFLAPLYLALLAFIATIRDYRSAWILLTALLFALGVNFFPAFQFHYLAAIVCLMILMCVKGLQGLSQWTLQGRAVGREAARLVLFLCVAHFLFWYSLHLFESDDFSKAMMAYETWDNINHQNPDRRRLVNDELASVPGKQLIFVRYSPRHIFQDEWVYNQAAIDEARVVWARDLGPDENAKLRDYYPDRVTWLLEPDSRAAEVDSLRR